MQNLIPVVIILGVLGFIAWKNWDKIKGVADKFNKPEPGTKEPESGAPYKVPDPKPDFGPLPPDAISPPNQINTGSDNWLTRANKPSPEVAAYMDARAAQNKPADFPIKPIPHEFSTGGGGIGQQHIKLGPVGSGFALYVTPSWKGQWTLQTLPHYNAETAGLSGTAVTFTLTDALGNSIVSKTYKHAPGEVVSFDFCAAGGSARGGVALGVGTYYGKLSSAVETEFWLHVQDR